MEAGLDLVPKTNLERFAAPPAQVDDAAFAQARKVDQPAANVAHDHAERLDAFDEQPQLASDRATAYVGRFDGRFGVYSAVRPRLPLRRLGFLFGICQGFG